jgi:hypothetical protein
MRGKYGDAADMLAKPGPYVLPSEVCETLANDLPRVFDGPRAGKLLLATEPLARKNELADSFGCVSRGLADAGRWEDAFHVAEQRAPAHNQRYDRFITEYGYRKHWKGPEDAAAWLKEKFSPAERNPLSLNAIYTKNYDVLWDVIEQPEPQNHPEWVWLLRAVAFAQGGAATDAHRQELADYYSKNASNPFDVMGRRVMGLAPEADVFALAEKGQPRSEVAYYLAAGAQRERKFPDACEWYRVAAESTDGNSPQTLALYTLSDWSGTGQGISMRGAAGEK